MRKRKNEILEVSGLLGMQFEELMRHQQTLRKELMGAFSKVLDDVLALIPKCQEKGFAVSWAIGKSGTEDALRPDIQPTVGAPRSLHPSSSSEVLDAVVEQQYEELADEYVFVDSR
jgi:hypothetical protein